MDWTDLTKLNEKDLKGYYDDFIRLERYKLAERIKRELDRRDFKKSSKEILDNEQVTIDEII